MRGVLRGRVQRWADVPRGQAYNPALDGVRAFAVCLVFLFHALQEQFPGGDIGVDIFFVLSGLLLTQAVLQRKSGGVRALLTFWSGRARRIWPALALVLVGGALVVLLVESHNAHAWVFEPLWAGTFLYNWYAIDAAASPELAAAGTSPFLPLWTLAVEEQFYLLWPLLLLSVSRGSSRRAVRWKVALFLATMVALSAALVAEGASWALIQWSSAPRFAELALGGLIATFMSGQHLSNPPEERSGWSPFAGSALLWSAGASICLYVVLAPDVEGWGQLLSLTFSAMAAGALIVGLQRSGPRSRAIWASKPAVVIGVLSYGIYLWQVPMLVLASEVLARADLTSEVLSVGVAGAMTLVAAAGSYLAVEAPFRRQPISSGTQQATLIARAGLLLGVAALAATAVLLAATRL